MHSGPVEGIALVKKWRLALAQRHGPLVPRVIKLLLLMNVQCVGSWENFWDHEMAPHLDRANQLFDKWIMWDPLYSGRFMGKDPDAGKDWGQEEKGMTEDEMVGWHHWHNGYEFEQTPGDSEGWESPACYIQSMGLQRVRHDLATEQQQFVKEQQLIGRNSKTKVVWRTKLFCKKVDCNSEINIKQLKEILKL